MLARAGVWHRRRFPIAAIVEPIDPSSHLSPPRALTLHHPHLRPPLPRPPRPPLPTYPSPSHRSPSSSSSPTPHLHPHLPHPQVRDPPPASARAQRPSSLDKARHGTGGGGGGAGGGGGGGNPRPTICTSWGRASRFLGSPRASPLGPQCRGGDPGRAERSQDAARGGGAGGGSGAGGGAGGTSWNAANWSPFSTPQGARDVGARPAAAARTAPPDAAGPDAPPFPPAPEVPLPVDAKRADACRRPSPLTSMLPPVPAGVRMADRRGSAALDMMECGSSHTAG